MGKTPVAGEQPSLPVAVRKARAVTLPSKRKPYGRYKEARVPWAKLFAQLDAYGGAYGMIDLVAGKAHVNASTLGKRYRRWLAERELTGSAAADGSAAASDARGGHNRALTVAQERAVYAYIKDVLMVARQPIGDGDIQLLALNAWALAHPNPHFTRSSPPAFLASRGWVHSYKQRYRLTYKSPHNSAPAAAINTAAETNFRASVLESIHRYGARFVLNLDEVSWKVISKVSPAHAHACRGRRGPADFLIWGRGGADVFQHAV